MAEEIPVAETRAFVKAVLSRARAYAHLYPEPETQKGPGDPTTPQPSIDGAPLVEANTLPAPADTPFNPELRTYVEHAPILEGEQTRAIP